MALPFSTNPMTMAENIRKLDDLTQATASSVASIPVDKIPKDYSTTETDTGIKWIDNKDIYVKTITGTLGENEITLDFVYDNIIFFYGSRKNTALNRAYDLNRAVQIYFTSGTNVIIGTASGVSGQTFILVAYYTKPDPVPGNREPDDAPDAEPELKKVTRKKTTKKEEE